MNRLVLALTTAAAVLGTGCGAGTHHGPCANSVTLDWNGGFQLADGSVVPCAAANVSWVDLFINDDPSTGVRVACTQSAAQAVDLPAGTNLFTVEGIDVRTGHDRIAFRAEVNVAAACGDQHVPVTPAEGTLVLDYALPQNACYAPGSRIFSAVRDDIANQPAFVDESGSSPLCAPSPAPAPTFLLPAGDYTLLGVNEWSPTVGGTGIVGADCTPRAFRIVGAHPTTVTASLVDVTPGSSACF